MFEQWLDHQLTELFGVPLFWIGRFAKLLQFISGLVIVTQIIGEERLDRIAQGARSDLKKLASLAPARRVIKSSFLYFWYFLKGSYWDEGKGMDYWIEKQKNVSWGPIYYIDVLFAVLFGVAAPFVLYNYFFSGSLFETIVNVLVSVVLGITTGVFVGNAIIPIALSLISLLIFYPAEFILDLFMKFADFVLGYSRITRIVLYVSLILFSVGMVLDLVAS